MFPDYDDRLKGPFPLLDRNNHRITSPQTPVYNCIGWAVDGDSKWWWPDPTDQYYWPEGVKREEDTDAFVHAFSIMGFEICEGGEMEEGFEKIVLYLKDNRPTHAAKQLNKQLWSSKLGNEYDIEHTIDALNGDAYGLPTIFFRRPI